MTPPETEPAGPPVRRRRPVPAFLVIGLLLVATGGIYAALTGPTSAQADTASSVAIEEGRKLFLVGCSSCHGLKAEGGSQAPSLIGVGAAAVDFQLSTGRMPAAVLGPQVDRKDPRYSPEQIEQLAAYVASLGGGPVIPSDEQLAMVSDADLAEGGELFRNNCAGCHNFAGKGGALTEGKYAPALDQATARQMYEAMLTGPSSMPAFADTQLTPEQKLAIIRYVEHIENMKDPGGFGLARLGPVPEGIVVFGVGIVLCVMICMWVGARS